MELEWKSKIKYFISYLQRIDIRTMFSYTIIEYAVQVGFELCAKASVVGTPATPECRHKSNKYTRIYKIF